MSEENLQNNTVSKLKRTGAQAAPSLFTLGNLACGFFSILNAAQGHYGKAGWLILFAAVFDLFDGRVARMLGTESNFGIEMDSLADAISFCTAPAMLMYFMVLHNYPVWGAPIACVYACFGILRLAKFNTMALAGEGSKKYFSGLPVPAPAAILASFAISYSIMQSQSGGHNLHIMTVYLPYIYNFVAIAMVVMALLSICAAAGTPAIPIAGTTMIFTVLSGMGWTTDACLLGYALVVAINRPVEMALLPLNVICDAAVNVIVNASEGELDKEVYNS